MFPNPGLALFPRAPGAVERAARALRTRNARIPQKTRALAAEIANRARRSAPAVGDEEEEGRARREERRVMWVARAKNPTVTPN